MSAPISPGASSRATIPTAPYPTRWRSGRGRPLGLLFERFRAFCGGHPLAIGSAYRTPRWNRLQGGAAASRHVEGRAIDPYPPAGMTMEEFHQRAREFAGVEAELVGGLGLYRWGVHLDMRARQAGRLVVWNQVPAGTAMHDVRV